MTENTNYHLVGIGGAGMSAMARLLAARGMAVSGSDRTESNVTRSLVESGVKVHIGHDQSHLGNAQIVVYSAAIPLDNPELETARANRLELVERSEMLGRLMSGFTHRVAIAGTHGKTTTTAMTDLVLHHAGMHPTSLVGGDVPGLAGNFRIGGPEIFLTEACEAFASFLHLDPSLAVITNIDPDHLDFYKTVENIETAFRDFAERVDHDGCVIACIHDARVKKVLNGYSRRVISYGIYGEPTYLANFVDVNSPHPSYTLLQGEVELGVVRLNVPGEHNILNSIAAAAVGLHLGASFGAVQAGLGDFRGAQRRFEILYNDGHRMVVDDYAHHPREIEATLKGARAAYGKHVIAIFQPHLYSRTAAFMTDFAKALANADEVIVTDIYAAREDPMPEVNSVAIVNTIRAAGHCNAHYIPDMLEAADYVLAAVGSEDMVLVLGAGDIRQAAERVAEGLSNK